MSTTSTRLVAVGLATAFVSFGLTGCFQTADSPTPGVLTQMPGERNPTGCISDFDANKDYFPDKSGFTNAVGVTVEYHKSYKVVTVKQPSPGAAAEQYVLVQCGATKPTLEGDLAKAPQIEIPSQRIASSSTTQVPPLEMLGVAGQVVGVSSPRLLFDGPIETRASEGKIGTFGNEDHSLNVEKIVAMKPDLFLSGGMEDPAYAKLRELKIPIVADSAWLDTTPLGRSEWIKYLGLFVNQEAKANEVFGKIEIDYKAVVAKVANVSTKPTVMLGQQTKGTWYVPGTESYLAAFVKDAGADYVYTGIKGTGSEKIAYETVLAKGKDAKFWLNGNSMGGAWNTKTDVVKDDPRYENFVAVKAGNIWNPTLRINANGGNDYWQQGVVRPDLVLGDMAAIFHPEIMTGHAFTFYEQVK